MNDKLVLTNAQITLIKQSWEKVIPIADFASGLFYERLFESSPHLRPLFKNADMQAQRKKLVKAINMVVISLERIDTLLPTLRDLGSRHVAYGVEDRHYEEVGAALLWTLEAGLKDDWNEALAEAWARAYYIIAGVMILGANLASSEQANNASRAGERNINGKAAHSSHTASIKSGQRVA